MLRRLPHLPFLVNVQVRFLLSAISPVFSFFLADTNGNVLVAGSCLTLLVFRKPRLTVDTGSGDTTLKHLCLSHRENNSREEQVETYHRCVFRSSVWLGYGVSHFTINTRSVV
jgi:hypothetical protein